mmetsp:Transcript_28406/g.27363  ORF Transcript_28406/g.27363 Transcript_28406/m.27363 type:complete len:257 (+) Transcript_28406:131-901(+)
MSQPLLLLRVFSHNGFVVGLGHNLLHWLVLSFNLLMKRVLSDFTVHLFVQIFQLGCFVSLKAFVPLRELSGIFFLLLLFQQIHVALHVLSEDVISMFSRVPVRLSLSFLNLSLLSFDFLSLLNVVPREPLFVVRNIESSISCSLQSSEHSVSCGSPVQAHIQESLEWSLFGVFGSDIKDFSINALDSLEFVLQLQSGQESPSNEKTSAVRGSIVGKASSESEVLELTRVSLAQHSISLNGLVDDLSDDSLVGLPHT